MPSVLSEKTVVPLQIGAVVTILGFTIWATHSISVFMSDSRRFQQTTTTIIEANRQDFQRMQDRMTLLASRQDAIRVDNWRASDMMTWIYELERANRDVQREGSMKGITVPLPKTVSVPPP